MIDQDDRDEDVMPVAIVAAGIRAARSCSHALRASGACSLCLMPNVARTVYVTSGDLHDSLVRLRGISKRARDEDAQLADSITGEDE